MTASSCPRCRRCSRHHPPPGFKQLLITAPYAPAEIHKASALIAIPETARLMMEPTPTSAPEPAAVPAMPEVIDAIVQAGRVETPYCCAGRGRRILVLSSRTTADPLIHEVFSALAPRFRVLAPTCTPAGRDSAALLAGGAGAAVWLRDVMDGLGLTRPSIVADECVGITALSFALSDPERVDRLVLLRRDRSDPVLQESVLGDPPGSAGHPLLVIWADPGDGASCMDPGVTGELIRFLEAPAVEPVLAPGAETASRP